MSQPSVPSTAEEHAGLSAEQLAEARQYRQINLICTLADRALDLAYLCFAAFVLAGPLDRWLQHFGWTANCASLRLFAFWIIVLVLHVLVSLPLSYYSGHALEHRFKLSTQSRAAWFWRYTKQLLLAAALGTVLIQGLFWLIWTTGSWWWLVAAGAFFVVSVVLGQLAPVLILPLFYKIERLDAPELSARLDRLAAGTGLTIQGVYRMGLSDETVKANAALAGLGRTRRVLLGDTLLSGFSPDEIEVIFAHEVGHHVHRHLPKMLAGGLATSLLGFWICDWALRQYVSGGQPISYAEMPVAVLPFLMLILTLFQWLLEPLQNFVSRCFERQSDTYALRRTGQNEAYVSAFRKLAQLNKEDPSPPAIEVLLFHSHPPIGQRLALAEQGRLARIA